VKRNPFITERKTGRAFARADVLFLERQNGRMSERASERVRILVSRLAGENPGLARSLHHHRHHHHHHHHHHNHNHHHHNHRNHHHHHHNHYSVTRAYLHYPKKKDLARNIAEQLIFMRERARERERARARGRERACTVAP